MPDEAPVTSATFLFILYIYFNVESIPIIKHATKVTPALQPNPIQITDSCIQITFFLLLPV